MKKIFTLLLMVAVCFSAQELSAQAKRKVLIERFTNASCGPCAVYGPAFNTLLAANEANLVVVQYQCNFPGTDPMNAQNGTDVSTRYNTTYPAVPSQGIPYCAMDGNKYNGHIANLTQANITARVPVTSPIEMTVDHNLSDKLDSMVIDITAKNVSNAVIPANTISLYTLMLEKLIKFGAAPGTNGETEFPNVMRKMYPSANGLAITTEFAAGETKTWQYRVAVPAYIYDLTQLGAVAFFQYSKPANTPREIIQSGESLPKPIKGAFYDVTAAFKADNRANNCVNTVNFTADIKNLSTNTDHITKIVFTPLINGLRKVKQSWTGDLAPGQNVQATLPNLNLGTTGGLLKVSWLIDTVYSTSGKIKELSTSNNFSEEFKYLNVPAAINGTGLNATFDTPVGTGAPAKTYFINEGVRLFKVDSAWGNNGTADFPNQMGGFGKSRYAACFYFWDQGVEGKSSYILFDKFAMKTVKNATATFSYAYSTKDISNTDQLDINVSTDCGNNWKTVWSNVGYKMATCDPDPSTFWIPGYWFPYADQWRAISIDLKEFDGVDELLVQVKGTGGGGNGLWFDDFKINTGVGVYTHDLGIINSVDVFPNPTHDLINVSAELQESAIGSIYVSDLSGKVVLSLANEVNLKAGVNQLSYPVELQAGMYQLEIRTAKGSSVQKISIF